MNKVNIVFQCAQHYIYVETCAAVTTPIYLAEQLPKYHPKILPAFVETVIKLFKKPSVQK